MVTSTKTPTKTPAKSPAKKPDDKPAKCQPFSVSVKIVTPDDKKEISFGITKGCNDDNTAFWIIDFTLKVKKGDELKTRVEVHITVGKDKDKEKAEALAATIKEQKKLDPARVDQLEGPVTTRAQQVTQQAAQNDPKLQKLLLGVL